MTLEELRRALRLYLVLDPDLCGGAQGMIETALSAVRGGASIVQLRAPSWKKRALAECAHELVRVLRPAGVPLFVDDHADVAFAAGAAGIHVGQKDLDARDCRRLLGPEAIIGLSISCVEELERAPVDVLDYYGLGPVFEQTTKPDAAPCLGISGLEALVRRATLPAVAIGGIKVENARAVLAAGVDGVAVVSAICGAAAPEAVARRFLD